MSRRFGVLFLFLVAAAPPRGTLDAFADALVDRARPYLPGARDLDVAVAVGGASERLQDELAGLLLARLRAAGVRSAARTRDHAAALRHQGFERLIAVELEVGGGKLRAQGSVYAWAPSLWSDETDTEAHLYAETPLDAELRALVPAAARPDERWQAHGVAVGDVDVLALAIGDLDGHGKTVVAGATAAEVIVWSWDGARFAEKRRWSLAGKPAPKRPRRDLAVVAVEDGAIVAHASPFATGVRRGRGAGEPRPGYPIAGGWCALEPGVDWFAGRRCSAPGLPERFWAAAALGGDGRTTLAAVDADGTLFVSSAAPGASAAPWSARGVGAQLALAALERGAIVATSDAVERGEPDAIVLRALAPELPIVHRVDRLPGNVRALAAGDVDNDGRVEVIAAVRDDKARRTELWMVN